MRRSFDLKKYDKHLYTISNHDPAFLNKYSLTLCNSKNKCLLKKPTLTKNIIVYYYLIF